MPSPSAALATQRPDLATFEEFDLEMQRRGFIASRVLPVVEVAKQSGSYGKITIESLLQNRETKRNPGAGYNRTNWTFGKATYATEEHGIEEPVDQREAAMYAEHFDAESMATKRAGEVVLRNQEQRGSDLVFNATTWTGSDLATAVSDEWDDYANAVPLTDVEAAVQKVYDNSGIWPNALVINRKVFRNLRLCASILSQFKSQGFVDVRASKITEQMLATIFDLDHIIVAGSSKNGAKEGQTATVSPIWSGEYAMVCRVAETQDMKEPCIGRIFHWGEDGSEIMGHVEQYYEEQSRSDIYRVRHDVDEVILYPEMGHLLSNITT